LEGYTPSEGIGKESSDDLLPLCRALMRMAFEDALAKASVAPARTSERIWLMAKRQLLRTRWGYRRAVRDVPTMMHAIQMVDIALRKKWGLRWAEPRLTT
jgi:hypothetical protein